MIVKEKNFQSIAQLNEAITNYELGRLMNKYPECEVPELMCSRPRMAFYLHLRKWGRNHNLALSFACQQFAGTRTEAEFFHGRHTLDAQFRGNEKQLEAVVAAARKHGFTPSPTMIYDPGLARFMGDPEAFIPASGGLTHVKNVLARRGMECSGGLGSGGLMEVKARQPEKEPEAGRLAPDLVNELVNQQIQENPDLARVDRRDLIAEVRAKHEFTDDKRFGVLTNVPNTEPSSPVFCPKRTPKRSKKK